MANRKYTGFDKAGKGTAPGLKVLMDTVLFFNAGKVSNLGTFMLRDMKGKPGKPSVHSTGRAGDIGWTDRAAIEGVINWLVTNADLLDIEYVADYFPAPGGRGWRCNRGAWSTYKKGQIAGAPGGKWIHVEVGPRLGFDKAGMEAAIKESFAA
jgi:hypothetical protein